MLAQTILLCITLALPRRPAARPRDPEKAIKTLDPAHKARDDVVV